ncbi:MAG TPA: DUF2179 domain-containing protein [Lentimicrobium sp.]|nr:DUF2179 domain-containing protein [Lentimicrobium sp.]
MDIITIFQSNSPLFSWVILPLLIFLARISDQTIGTIRLIFLSKGYKHLAPFLGFFEVIIWLITVSQIMQHLDNVMCYIAYGGGFAMGNFIGMTIEERLSIGTVMIRVIPRNNSKILIQKLREHNYGVTSVAAEGSQGNVDVIFTIIKRKEISHCVSIINDQNPTAFYTIEDIKSIKEGIFRQSTKQSIFEDFSFKVKKNK